VGSRTAPVQEVIEHGRNGWLTDFFDPEALAQQLAEVLQRGPEVQATREAARATVVQRYDLLSHCLPAGLKLLERVAMQPRAAQPA
jgi:glycosyltransferase involved in cell wall biosynthesis